MSINTNTFGNFIRWVVTHFPTAYESDSESEPAKLLRIDIHILARGARTSGHRLPLW